MNAIRDSFRVSSKKLFLSLLMVTLSSANCFAEEAYFEGKVVVEWLEHDGEDRLVRLIEPFSFTDGRGTAWNVPKGAKVDGASIPRLLWTMVGPPFIGDYRRASVIHDYYCDEKTNTWKATHRMFYEAMLEAGVSTPRAKLMYGAVFAAGPRWELTFTKGLEGDKLISLPDNSAPGITSEELNVLEEKLNKNDSITLEDIEQLILSN